MYPIKRERDHGQEEEEEEEDAVRASQQGSAEGAGVPATGSAPESGSKSEPHPDHAVEAAAEPRAEPNAEPSAGMTDERTTEPPTRPTNHPNAEPNTGPSTGPSTETGTETGTTPNTQPDTEPDAGVEESLAALRAQLSHAAVLTTQLSATSPVSLPAAASAPQTQTPPVVKQEDAWFEMPPPPPPTDHEQRIHQYADWTVESCASNDVERAAAAFNGSNEAISRTSGGDNARLRFLISHGLGHLEADFDLANIGLHEILRFGPSELEDEELGLDAADQIVLRDAIAQALGATKPDDEAAHASTPTLMSLQVSGNSQSRLDEMRPPSLSNAEGGAEGSRPSPLSPSAMAIRQAMSLK